MMFGPWTEGMEWAWTIWLAILGLLIGSFLNVVALRVPVGESIVKPRSHCTSCGRTLTAWELIPIVGWLWGRGKCRTCGVKLSPLYLLGEIATAFLFAWLPHERDWSLEAWAGLLLVILLMVCTISDIKYRIIPDKVLLVILPLALLLRIIGVGGHSIVYYLLGLVAGGGVLYAIAAISVLLKKPAMGGGDIKLMAVVGVFLGPGLVLLSIFLAALFGSVISIVGLASGRLKGNSYIAFGPFLALGSLAAYLYGDSLIHWYMNLFQMPY